MQYLVAVAWIAYILHGLRRAYAEHCIAQRARQLLQRLAEIEVGMTPGEIQSLLGPPARVTASPEGITWQYRVDGTFHPITFVRGAVAGREEPPVGRLDEMLEDVCPSGPEDEGWEGAALEGLRRAS